MNKKPFTSIVMGIAGGLAAWMLGVWLWAMWYLGRRDVHRTLAEPQNQAPKGRAVLEEKETEIYTVTHLIEDGIERVTYTPKRRRFETPIFFQHGMWHGAWCWQHWQALFAGWGWESHAISLPGHTGSPSQRPMQLTTLDYYLAFIKTEIERLPRKPVLVGHSMGGALTQWYLRHVDDDLPAVVLVAPWVSHRTLEDGLPRFLKLDPLGVFLMFFTLSATQFMRTPYHAAKKLTTGGALYTPEELHARLGPESGLVMLQHNPPFWAPAEEVRAPMLWLAAEKDTLIGEPAARQSAAHYKADYVVVPDAGHNLMMEHNYRATAEQVRDWLAAQGVE
ncbi:MAG: alpha/beta hydrolase [Anaerolineae bacterium]|nr:alpha/beta hydrolase [Anaerolineae bacterium]